MLIQTNAVLGIMQLVPKLLGGNLYKGIIVNS